MILEICDTVLWDPSAAGHAPKKMKKLDIDFPSDCYL